MQSTVRCKFKCDEVNKNTEDGTSQVILRPVTYGSKENEDFFKYTPWGELKFGTINENATKQFEVGNQYYIDITQA